MSSPDLLALQRLFQQHVQSGAVGIERHVMGSVPASEGERIRVYADAYRLRLLEILGKDFPGVHRLLGEGEFERLGRDYIAAHPSDTRSIRWFGRHLPAYLRLERRDRPVLAEMAAFEWQQGEVFDAADAAVATEADVAAVPADSWPRMRLVFHPSVRQLELGWNVTEYWQAVSDDRPVPAPRLHAERGSWLLWRQSLAVHWRPLARDESPALDAALRGAAFGELCERLVEHVAEEAAALRAASLLKRWLADGLVSKIEEV